MEANAAAGDGAARPGVAVDLEGKAVLVTGGAGGLGLACARLAARAGARIVLSDLPGERLEQARDEMAADGAQVEAIGIDVAQPGAGRSLVDDARSRFGRLDGLVAAAGIMQTKPFADLTEEDWRRIVDVNLTGTFLVVQAAATSMAEHDGGSIVLFSSVAGRSGRANAAHYAATKTAILSLTKSAALAFAPSVRVNALCPGVIMTDMWRGILRDRSRMGGEEEGQAYLEHLRTSSPLQRIGEPDEIATAALFLLSDMSSFITGQGLNVDGGLEMD